MKQLYAFTKVVLFWIALIVFGLFLAIVTHKDHHGGGH
jgi:hypothetical protein